MRIHFAHQLLEALFKFGRAHPSRPVHDDVVTFNTQSSSQWDGFRHYGEYGSGCFYGGATAAVGAAGWIVWWGVRERWQGGITHQTAAE